MSDLCFKQVLDTADSISGLQGSIALLAEHLGIRHFACQGRVNHDITIDESSSYFFVIGNRQPWHDFWMTQNLHVEENRVVRTMMSRSTPIRWKDLAMVEPSLYQSARLCELTEGITHVVHGAGQTWSVTSLLWDANNHNGDQKNSDAVSMGQLLACHIHDAAKRIIGNDSNSAKPVSNPSIPHKLTLRERECLTLSASGSTSSQIAHSLAITERTVSFHLAQARQRLGVSNSRQAASKALSMGLISIRA